MRGTKGTISKPGTEWPEDAEAIPGNVELPVCPWCGLVGKNPGVSSATYACVGPAENQHKRTRMILVEYGPVGHG